MVLYGNDVSTALEHLGELAVGGDAMSKEQAQGMLFGLALGDALGRQTEFKNLRGIRQIYGPQGIQEPPNPALYTDDTQLTIALTEGLLLDSGLNAPLEEQMNAIGIQFIRWKNDAPKRAPDDTCLRGIRRFESGSSWDSSGIDDSSGSGATTRVASIGYLYQNDDDRLREIAQASAAFTHRHPGAIASAVASAYLVKLALNNTPVNQFLQQVIQFCGGISEDLDAALLRVGHVLGWMDEEAAMRHIGEGWNGVETVALAIYCVLRYTDNYTDCVRRAANTNGNSDSIACIAGGMMGARFGLNTIPVKWATRCENAEYLMELGSRMAEAYT